MALEPNLVDLNKIELDKIKKLSAGYFRNPQTAEQRELETQTIRNYIGYAINFNEAIHRETLKMFLQSAKKLSHHRKMLEIWLNTLLQMADLMKKSNIKTEKEIFIYRSTSFPNTTKDTFISTSDRDDYGINAVR